MTTRTPTAPSVAPTPVAAAAKKVVQQTAVAPAPAATTAAPAPKKAAPAPVAAPATATEAKKAATKKQAADKPAKASKTVAKAAPKAEKEAKEPKPKKPKLVRDSFTFPKDEYAAIESLKLRGAKLNQPAKKSELLRAGLKLLVSLTDQQLLAALQAVPAIKTGRPSKN